MAGVVARPESGTDSGAGPTMFRAALLSPRLVGWNVTVTVQSCDGLRMAPVHLSARIRKLDAFGPLSEGCMAQFRAVPFAMVNVIILRGISRGE